MLIAVCQELKLDLFEELMDLMAPTRATVHSVKLGSYEEDQPAQGAGEQEEEGAQGEDVVA